MKSCKEKVVTCHQLRLTKRPGAPQQVRLHEHCVSVFGGSRLMQAPRAPCFLKKYNGVPFDFQGVTHTHTSSCKQRFATHFCGLVEAGLCWQPQAMHMHMQVFYWVSQAFRAFRMHSPSPPCKHLVSACAAAVRCQCDSSDKNYTKTNHTLWSWQSKRMACTSEDALPDLSKLTQADPHPNPRSASLLAKSLGGTGFTSPAGVDLPSRSLELLGFGRRSPSDQVLVHGLRSSLSDFRGTH